MSWAMHCFCWSWKQKFISILAALHSWARSCWGFLLSCEAMRRVGRIAKGLKYTAVRLAKAWLLWRGCLVQALSGWQILSTQTFAPSQNRWRRPLFSLDNQLILWKAATAPRSSSGHIQKLCVLQEDYRPPLGTLGGQLPSLLASQHHPELIISAGPEAFHELAWSACACFPIALNKKLTISNCQYPSLERHATALLLRAYSPLLYLEQFEKTKFQK